MNKNQCADLIEKLEAALEGVGTEYGCFFDLSAVRFSTDSNLVSARISLVSYTLPAPACTDIDLQTGDARPGTHIWHDPEGDGTWYEGVILAQTRTGYIYAYLGYQERNEENLSTGTALRLTLPFGAQRCQEQQDILDVLDE